RHTRSYGDWSSDVCSSDLIQFALQSSNGIWSVRKGGKMALPVELKEKKPDGKIYVPFANQLKGMVKEALERQRKSMDPDNVGGRSEERRVGKEGRWGRGGE